MSDFDSVLNTNLRSVFLLSKAAARLMLRRKKALLLILVL